MDTNLGSHRQVHMLLLMAVTVAGLYLCYRLAAPFVPAMAGALALAVLFAPLHRRLEQRLRPGNFAAGVSVLVVALVVEAAAMALECLNLWLPWVVCGYCARFQANRQRAAANWPRETGILV